MPSLNLPTTVQTFAYLNILQKHTAMRKQKAGDLAKKAKRYLGKELTILLLDEQLYVNREIICRFENWHSIGFKDGAEMDVKQYAELIDMEDNKKYTLSLKLVVEEFEKVLLKV
jgi:hypothetical protein